jgi:hypothetical protein
VVGVSSAFAAATEERNDDYWYNFGHGALELTIEEYAVDDQEPGSYGLREDLLVLEDFEWEQLTLSGRIDVPDGLSDHVFEPGADPGVAGRLFVRADCIRTHNRFPATVVDSFAGDDEYEVQIPLQRANVAKSIRLEPVLIRGSRPSQMDYSYGQTPGMRLADGRPFEVDSSGDEEGETFLPIEAVSFEEEDHGDELFYLDHSVASEPVLYIDSDVKLLETALKSGARHGVKRWTKETLQKLIVQPVWVELILWTASDVADGKCQYGWQEDVLSALASVEDESPGEIAVRMEAQVADGDRVDTLAEQANKSARAILSASGPLEKLLDEVL